MRIAKLFLSGIFLLNTYFSIPAQEISLKGKELFGNMQARQIGPALMSGRINDIELHPNNPRIMYIGAAGGGVWKSLDGGATFNPIFDDYVQSIGVVKLDPNEPDNVIWVGTGETWTRNSVSIGNGLFKSSDGGKTWKNIKGFENSERISSIVINPSNSNEIYVGVLGALWSDSEDRGIYKSLDGGETWDKIFYINQTTGVGDIIMDPQNSNILYTSMWEFRRTGWSFNSGGVNSGLYKSTNGGKSWNKIHNGFPEGKLGRIAVDIAPSNSNILYAVLETEDKAKNGLWKSTDAGGSWSHLNNDFELTVRPFYFSRITVDPTNPDVLIKGGFSGSISRDGGNTFKNLGNMHSDIHDVVFHIKDSDVIYSGTDGGFYRSWNGGTTFEICENLPLSQFYYIATDNEEPYNVYGGLQDNGSWYGPSSSPGGVEARDWNSVGYGDGFRVLKHPTKNITYSEMQGAQYVWRVDIDKRKSKTIQPFEEKGQDKLRFNWNTPITISENVPDRLYIGSQFLHKSEDMGNSWEIISPDLTTNDKSKQNQGSSGGLSRDNSGAENHTTIFTIVESPLNQNIIWVGTDDGQIQITKNGGKNWENLTPNLVDVPSQTWVYHIEASAHAEGTAYAVFDGHTKGDFNTYVLKTTDYGKTWKNIISADIENNAFARSIQEDYVNENLLFLGTEFGLYITVDGGVNWTKFTNNMPSVAIHHLEMQKKTNDIVMGTHGRGVIIIDDVSPLRDLNAETVSKNVHFFPTEPFIMKEQSGFSGRFGRETQFVGPSKSSLARIVYYLKKRHTFGKMTLEIQDMNGQVISNLTPGKSKGINIVNWDFSSKAPKTAEGKTVSNSGFISKRVSAGKYKVVLKKGKKSYEHIIELNYDDEGNGLLASRKEQEKTTNKLFDLVEDLAYLVYQVKETNKWAKDLAKKLPKSKKTTTKASAELEALHKTLVITTGDNYVDSAEPELREKLSKLYQEVATNYESVSPVHKQNFIYIKDEFLKAHKTWDKIYNKSVLKMNKMAKNNNIEIPSLLSKEAFLEK